MSGLRVGVEVFFFLGGARGSGIAGGPITVTEAPWGLVTTAEGLVALDGVVRGLVLDTMSGGGGLTSVTELRWLLLSLATLLLSHSTTLKG